MAQAKSQRAAEDRRIQYEMERAGDLFWGREPTAPSPRKATTTKCDSCGSREWVAHAGKEVCAYCRSDRA
jgi:hypothetical protein